MNRTPLVPLFLSFAFFMAAPRLALAADDDLTVLNEKGSSEFAPRKMLSAYLLDQAKVQFNARRQAVAALKTPDDLKRRQEELRGKFMAAIGGFPERTPLNPKVVGSEDRDGYKVERVIYESRPNHHVTANFYLPSGKGPFPGVLVPCGHSNNGKAADAYQRVCILLAKNGIAALIYDPIGQAERVQLLDPPGKPVTGSTNEHTLVGVGAMLVGQSTASYRIWDGIRSLDYLAGRTEIDPKRLGCTGNSGGGTLTAYLMALDDRIGPAAPSCYITSLERLFATLGPQDGEQNIPGQVAFGMEHADYVTMRAPKPTLLLLASRDFFDLQGSWTTFREAKQLYGIMGFSERVDVAEYDTPHGYGRGQRESMVRFMRRWLLNKDDAIVEEKSATAKDQDIQCTRTGQVLEDFKGRTAFDITAEYEKELAGQRGKGLAGQSPEETIKAVRRLIGLDATIKSAKVEKQSEPTERDGYGIVKVLFETEAGIKVPALEFVPKKNGTPLVIYVNGDGKAAVSGPAGACAKLVQADNRVFAVNLRGFGETAPGTVQANRPNFFGADFKETYLGIHLNRPLLGQRVYDLLALVEYLANAEATKNSPIHVIGTGTAGPIVLHAAALDARIKQVTVEQSVLSWSLVAQTPVTYNQLTNVVPGALKVYDLPDLAALIAPRPLTVRAPVDAINKKVTQAVLDEAFARCKACYADKKAEKVLTLQAD